MAGGVKIKTVTVHCKRFCGFSISSSCPFAFPFCWLLCFVLASGFCNTLTPDWLRKGRRRSSSSQPTTRTERDAGANENTKATTRKMRPGMAISGQRAGAREKEGSRKLINLNYQFGKITTSQHLFLFPRLLLWGFSCCWCWLLFCALCNK